MKAVACFAKGFRTIFACLAFIMTGLLSVFGALDLQPVIALFVKDPEILAAAMVAVGALFGFLRYVSTTPMFSPHPVDAVDDVDQGRLKRDIEVGA